MIIKRSECWSTAQHFRKKVTIIILNELLVFDDSVTVTKGQGFRKRYEREKSENCHRAAKLKGNPAKQVDVLPLIITETLSERDSPAIQRMQYFAILTENRPTTNNLTKYARMFDS